MAKGTSGERSFAECEMTTAARDGCVVITEHLAGILIPVIDEYPTINEGVEFIAMKSGIPVRTVENITKRSRATGQPSPHAKTTELRVADRILTAIGHTESFELRDANDRVVIQGTLQVFQNERAPEHIRGSCCGRPKEELRDRLRS